MLKTSGLPSWKVAKLDMAIGLYTNRIVQNGDCQVLVKEAPASKPGFGTREKICLVSVCCDVRCVLGTGPLGWEGTVLPSKASIPLGNRAQRREERLRWKREAGCQLAQRAE